MDVGVMKPFHTGCTFSRKENRLLPKDSLFLMKASGVHDRIGEVSPYCFREAAAPSLAATRQGRKIDLKRVIEIYRRLSGRHGFMVIEGIGGVLVPLYRNIVLADLIREMNLPVLVVSRTALGTINHTLLSLEALRSRGIKVSGVLFNHPSPTPHQSTLPLTLEVVRTLGKVPIRGILPYGKNVRRWTPYRLSAWMKTFIDPSFLNSL
jgi:dethiobiotin synthetase